VVVSLHDEIERITVFAFAHPRRIFHSGKRPAVVPGAVFPHARPVITSILAARLNIHVHRHVAVWKADPFAHLVNVAGIAGNHLAIENRVLLGVEAERFQDGFGIAAMAKAALERDQHLVRPRPQQRGKGEVGHLIGLFGRSDEDLQTAVFRNHRWQSGGSGQREGRAQQEAQEGPEHFFGGHKGV